MSNIKAVIFDCFGVLYVDPSQYFYEKYVKNYRELKAQLDDLHRAFDYGIYSEKQLNKSVSEVTGLSESFVAEKIHGTIIRNEPLIEYMSDLRRRGYKIGMLSNIGRGAMEMFFSKEESNQLFDEAVLSNEVGLVKPTPRIFELIAERLGESASECIMIDDRVENCRGAETAGMRSVLYSYNQRTIGEVEALLK